MVLEFNFSHTHTTFVVHLVWMKNSKWLKTTNIISANVRWHRTLHFYSLISMSQSCWNHMVYYVHFYFLLFLFFFYVCSQTLFVCSSFGISNFIICISRPTGYKVPFTQSDSVPNLEETYISLHQMLFSNRVWKRYLSIRLTYERTTLQLVYAMNSISIKAFRFFWHYTGKMNMTFRSDRGLIFEFDLNSRNNASFSHFITCSTSQKLQFFFLKISYQHWFSVDVSSKIDFESISKIDNKGGYLLRKHENHFFLSLFWQYVYLIETHVEVEFPIFKHYHVKWGI